MPQIILASSSIYRKELFERLSLDFQIIKPDMEEIRMDSESAYDTADRLSEEKTKKVSSQFKEAIVIGCDQTAEYNNIQIQKPLNHKMALLQLKELSGKRVNFHSGVCVHYNKQNILQKKVISFDVKYKNLKLAEIESYLEKEKPYNCVGSIKSEGLGISLLDEINSSDPTAIIGLPLITLVKMLRKVGVNINA